MKGGSFITVRAASRRRGPRGPATPDPGTGAVDDDMMIFLRSSPSPSAAPLKCPPPRKPRRISSASASGNARSGEKQEAGRRCSRRCDMSEPAATASPAKASAGGPLENVDVLSVEMPAPPGWKKKVTLSAAVLGACPSESPSAFRAPSSSRRPSCRVLSWRELSSSELFVSRLPISRTFGGFLPGVSFSLGFCFSCGRYLWFPDLELGGGSVGPRA